MNETVVLIIISYFIIVIMGLVLFLARKEIMFTMKAKFLKKRGYGKVIEMRNNKTIRTHLQKLQREKAEIGDRTYGINPSDVCFDVDTGIPAIIVNESLVKSIGFIPETQNNPIDSSTLTKLITRAKTIGAMGFNDDKKLFFIVFAGLGLVVILAIVIAYYSHQNQQFLIQTLEAVKNIRPSAVIPA
jgi:hypothetical protein